MFADFYWCNLVDNLFFELAKYRIELKIIFITLNSEKYAIADKIVQDLNKLSSSHN